MHISKVISTNTAAERVDRPVQDHQVAPPADQHLTTSLPLWVIHLGEQTAATRIAGLLPADMRPAPVAAPPNRLVRYEKSSHRQIRGCLLSKSEDPATCHDAGARQMKHSYLVKRTLSQYALDKLINGLCDIKNGVWSFHPGSSATRSTGDRWA